METEVSLGMEFSWRTWLSTRVRAENTVDRMDWLYSNQPAVVLLTKVATFVAASTMAEAKVVQSGRFIPPVSLFSGVH